MRPFRNPESHAQVEANRLWRNGQLARRNPDPEAIQWTADWQIDHGRMWADDGNGNNMWAVPPAIEAGALRPERIREVPNNRQYMKDFPELNLDKLKPGPDIHCDISLSPFRVDYDTHEQVEQKLRGTVILIKNVPFHIPHTIDLGRGKFALLLTDAEGNHKTVKYDDVKDCRGIAPGYFMYRSEALWLYRVPERQNQQGMSQRNMQYTPAGGGPVKAPSHGLLLSCLSIVQDVTFSPNLQDVLLGGGASSLRLSNRIALYQTKKKGAPIGVEYCGRPLGLIIRDAVKVLDENDLRPSWIHKDLHKVNLSMDA